MVAVGARLESLAHCFPFHVSFHAEPQRVFEGAMSVMSRLRTRATLYCGLCLILAACGATDGQTPSRGSTRGGESLASGPTTGSSGLSTNAAYAGSGAPGVVPPPGGPLLPRATGLANSGGVNGKVCASAVVQAAKTPPIVVFVIDGSGSMCAPYGAGGTRWQALRGALLDPNTGLIYKLQDQVKFGALLYDGTVDLALALLGGGGPGGPGGPVPGGPGGPGGGDPPCALAAAMNKMSGMCPALLYTPADINNAMAIDMAYPMVELGGSTPTDRAMKQLMDSLIPMVGLQGPDDKKPSEIFVILATDGAPNDVCVGGAGGDGAAQRAGVIAEVQRGAVEGIKTWVISLADDALLQAHLDEVARAGAPADPAAPASCTRANSPTSGCTSVAPPSAARRSNPSPTSASSASSHPSSSSPSAFSKSAHGSGSFGAQ